VSPLQVPLWVTQQAPDSHPWPQQSGAPLQVARAALQTA
jgi:hypothetical protein